MEFLQQLFRGRNGSDQLNLALLAVGFGFNMLSRMMFQNLFVMLSYVALGVCLFRMISRNIPKRQQENAWFLELVRQLRKKAPGSGAAGGSQEKRGEESFSYLKCPKCGQFMRVPQGKGRIKITCSRCGNVFYENV